MSDKSSKSFFAISSLAEIQKAFTPSWGSSPLLEPKALYYASLNQRVKAFIIDFTLLGSLLALIGLPWYGWLISFTLYFSLFEASKWQATPGERLCHIEVMDIRGKKLKWSQILLRNTIYCFTLGLSSLGCYFSKKKQALHDKLSASCVYDD